MVTELRIYFEGDTQLRPGFRQFLIELAETARQKRCHFELIATNGTPVPDFADALKANPKAWNVLLLDSDAPFTGSLADLCRSKKLDPSHEASVFWMVHVMESWFLADVAALKDHYGKAFQESAVKGNPKVEEIPKIDVLSRLKKATNGEYHKTKHASKLLATIDPAVVRQAAPNCERMFRALLKELSKD
jgi:hypothetical protein